MINNAHIKDTEYASIEEKLFSSLRPIKPDPHFINQLQNRLIRRSNITLDTRNKSMALIVMAVGLFVGGLLFFVLHKCIKT